MAHMSPPPDADQSPPSDAPRANQADRDAMLRDANLFKSMTGIVRRCGVVDADNEDVVQVALTAAHKAANLPKNPDERVKYVHQVTHNEAVSHLRGAPGTKVTVWVHRDGTDGGCDSRLAAEASVERAASGVAGHHLAGVALRRARIHRRRRRRGATATQASYDDHAERRTKQTVPHLKSLLM